MNKALPIALAVLLAVFAIMFAYTTQGPTEGSESVELRVYDVPQEYHADIKSALRYALGADKGEQDVGRVTTGPNNTLVVTAPPRIHKGVEAFLSDLEGVATPPAQPTPISLTYWFIVGRPVEPSATASRPYIVTGKRKLTELEPALKQIASVQGAMEFRLLEKIRLTSIGHDRAESRGKFAMVEQRATRTPHDSIVGEVILAFDGRNQIRSQVMLEPNQVLVLGQAGYAGTHKQPFGPGEDISDAALYYVITSNLEQ